MIQGSYSFGREMPRTWQHLPKYLAAHLLDRYSIDIRLFFDFKSNNNRTTIEEQTKNSAGNYEANTCQIRGNSMATTKQ